VTTILSQSGTVPIPDEYRQLDNLQPGDDFEVRRTAPGKYVLEKLAATNERASRCSSQYGHDVLVAPPGSPALTPELVRALLDET